MEARIYLARADFWVRIDVDLVCWSSSVVTHQEPDHKPTASGCRSSCRSGCRSGYPRQETKSDEVDTSLFKTPEELRASHFTSLWREYAHPIILSSLLGRMNNEAPGMSVVPWVVAELTVTGRIRGPAAPNVPKHRPKWRCRG